jgi:hypothetical protein
MPKGIYQRKSNTKVGHYIRTPEIRFILSQKSMGNKSHYKGNKVGYWGLHRWLDRTLGRPRKCAKCGTTESKRYEWANISGKYKRETNDYLRLCRKCHCEFDKRNWGKTLNNVIPNWDAQRL